ncbi:MAG: hypothetical protein KC609_05455 [Myxococcales bacterium]|nr:hypothetical protein [Myxococcales bacterium]
MWELPKRLARLLLMVCALLPGCLDSGFSCSNHSDLGKPCSDDKQCEHACVLGSCCRGGEACHFQVGQSCEKDRQCDTDLRCDESLRVCCFGNFCGPLGQARSTDDHIIDSDGRLWGASLRQWAPYSWFTLSNCRESFYLDRWRSGETLYQTPSECADDDRFRGELRIAAPDVLTYRRDAELMLVVSNTVDVLFKADDTGLANLAFVSSPRGIYLSVFETTSTSTSLHWVVGTPFGLYLAPKSEQPFDGMLSAVSARATAEGFRLLVASTTGKGTEIVSFRLADDGQLVESRTILSLDGWVTPQLALADDRFALARATPDGIVVQIHRLSGERLAEITRPSAAGALWISLLDDGRLALLRRASTRAGDLSIELYSAELELLEGIPLLNPGYPAIANPKPQLRVRGDRLSVLWHCPVLLAPAFFRIFDL